MEMNVSLKTDSVMRNVLPLVVTGLLGGDYGAMWLYSCICNVDLSPVTIFLPLLGHVAPSWGQQCKFHV